MLSWRRTAQTAVRKDAVMQTAIGGHAGDEELELYSMGKLEGAQLEGIEEHLLVCASCQDRLAETDIYVRAARAVAAKLAAEPRQERPSFWGRLRTLVLSYEPILITVAIAVVLIAVFWVARPSPEGLNPPVAAVVLETARGETTAATVARESRPFLRIDVSELPPSSSYVVELVSAQGEAIWQSEATPSGGKLGVSVEKTLAGGTYWVRLYSPAPERTLLREYGLRAE
jgi:hypothetical protein